MEGCPGHGGWKTKCLLAGVVMLLCVVGTGGQECSNFMKGVDFTVTADVVELVNGNLQKVVDCVPNEGLLKFDPGLITRVNSTIELNRPILVSSDGLAETRPVLKCPEQGDAVFNIRSSGVIIQNLVMKDCNIASDTQSAVVINLPRSSTGFQPSVEEIVLEDILVSRNKNSQGAGSILVRSAKSVSFSKVVFENNTGENGGAILLNSQDIEIQIDRCIFRENIAFGRGGAIYQEAGADIVIVESDFVGNNARYEGGAIGMQESPKPNSLFVSESTFQNNSADGDPDRSSGGALSISGSPLSLTIISSRILNNRASLYGGAIKISDTQNPGVVLGNVDGSIFEENTALMGGAIYVSPVLWSTSLSLHNTSFSSNNATSSSSISSAKGGALYVQGPLMQLNVTKNLFDGNQAIGSSGMESTGAQGGAMFVEDLIQMSITESVFSSNKASHNNKLQHPSAGGAIFFLETGMNRGSRVKEASRQSACNSQCDSNIAAEKFGLQNAVAGCGESRGVNVCILRDHTKCRGIRTTKIASKVAAECEVVDLRGTAQVSRTVFSNNKASEGGAVAIDGAWTLSLEDGVWFLNNRASRSGGAVIARDKAQIWGSDAVFSGNEAVEDGGALFLQGTESQVVLNSSILTENEAVSGSGGALMLLGVDSLVLLENSTELVRNRAGKDGGAISIYSASAFLDAQQVIFEDNKAKWNGGGLHAQALHGSSNIVLEDVSFVKNSANYSPPKELKNSSKTGLGGAISLQGSGMGLKTHGVLQFISNEAREGGAIRLMESGPVDIVNAAFHDNSGLSGGAIHATFGQRSQNNALSIKNAAFWKNTAFMGGGLMIDAQRSSGAFALDDPFSMSLFNDSPSSKGPQLTMKNITMWEQAAAKEGAGILLIDAAASCYNCSFVKNSVTGAYGGAGGGISLWRAARFTLEKGIFNSNTAVYGGGVSVVDSVFIGKQLDFASNGAQKAGGAIFVRSQNRIAEQMDTSLLELTETKLRRNRAKIGAGIYGHIEDAGCATLMDDYRMLPHSIDFFGSHSKLVDICRQAESGFRHTPAYLTLLDVELRGNMASAAGGGVYINAPKALCVCCGESCSETCRIPLRRTAAPLASMCSNLWTQNSVSQGYGSLIASGPLTAEVVLESGRILQDGYVLEEAHKSGDSLAVLTVRFLDFSESVVYSMPAGDFVYIMSQTGALSGQTDKQVVEGVAKFDGVYFTGQPGNHTLIIKFPESLGIANLRIRIQIRDCKRGEWSLVGENSYDFKCISCANRGYNVDPGSPCQPCPENAQCDGENIVPENGYWQSTSRSTEMQECPRKHTCTYSDRTDKLMNFSRSYSEPMSYDVNPVLCSEGHEGVICGSCSDGYGQMSGFKCQKCLSKPESILTMSFISFWAFLVFTFFVQNALASGQVIRVVNVTTSASHLTPSGEGSSGLSAGVLRETDEQKFSMSVNPMVEGIKILINFLQVTSMAAALDSDWTTELKLMFNVEDFLSGVVTNTCTGSFECAIRSSPLIPSVQRVVLMLTFPVGFALIMIFYWCFITFLKQGSWRYLQRRIFITFLVTCFLFYTEVTETVFQIFSHVRVKVPSDGVNSESVETVYWAADTKLEFFKGAHWHLLSLMGIPFLALFSIGFPVAVFVVLWRNRHTLYHDWLSKRFGFLYQAYSEKLLYWELMVFARKAIIAGIAVFGYHWGPNLQELGASGVLFAALIIHLVAQPYREEIYGLNHMETLSLTCSFFTYAVGLALNDKVLPVQARHVLSGTAIGLTVLFVTVLFAHLIVDGYRSLRSWIHGLGIEIPENASIWTRIALVWQCVWNNCMCWFWKSLENKLALPATRRPLPWNDGIMLSSSRISMSDRTERIRV